MGRELRHTWDACTSFNFTSMSEYLLLLTAQEYYNVEFVGDGGLNVYALRYAV